MKTELKDGTDQKQTHLLSECPHLFPMLQSRLQNWLRQLAVVKLKPIVSSVAYCRVSNLGSFKHCELQFPEFHAGRTILRIEVHKVAKVGHP